MQSYEDELAAQDLADLQWHWSEAYQIERTGPRAWVAARRDGKGALHASTAADLRTAIRDDYEGSPVPRDGETPQ